MPDEEEEIETELEEEEEEIIEPEPPPKKWAGKYASEDELEKAYVAEQAKLTQLAQENAKLRELATTQVQPQNPPAPSSEGPWYAGVFESEEELGRIIDRRSDEKVYGAIGQFASIIDARDANIETILLDKEADPMYKQVNRKFRIELRKVPAHQMVDPGNAAAIAETVFNAVCGQHAREVLSKTRENPSERLEHLKALGVESPQARENTDVEAVTRSEVEMLRGLGLTKKSREQVIRRVAAQSEEEED